MGGSSYKGDDAGSMTSVGRAKAHKTSGINATSLEELIKL